MPLLWRPLVITRYHCHGVDQVKANGKCPTPTVHHVTTQHRGSFSGRSNGGASLPSTHHAVEQRCVFENRAQMHRRTTCEIEHLCCGREFARKWFHGLSSAIDIENSNAHAKRGEIGLRPFNDLTRVFVGKGRWEEQHLLHSLKKCSVKTACFGELLATDERQCSIHNSSFRSDTS